jgi:hypothetical protein
MFHNPMGLHGQLQEQSYFTNLNLVTFQQLSRSVGIVRSRTQTMEFSFFSSTAERCKIFFPDNR